ncbi:hypothetical protein MTO96_042071 [Rhipicephalus appendiculatus]
MITRGRESAAATVLRRYLKPFGGRYRRGRPRGPESGRERRDAVRMVAPLFGPERKPPRRHSPAKLSASIDRGALALSEGSGTFHSRAGPSFLFPYFGQGYLPR